MKKLILTILFVCLMTMPVLAGEKEEIEYVTAKYNAAQVPQVDAGGNPIPIVPITKGQYIKAMIKDVVNDYVRQGLADDTSSVSKKYEAATDAQKAQIKALLGL